MRLNKKSYKEYKTYPEKVLQFGEGNFLRAFVDWQIDKMNKKAGFNGSVVVVQPIESGLVDKLNEQDGLYTLYLQGMNEGHAIAEHSVINSISRGINPYTQHAEFLKVAENPELRFVFSNTTEAGIAFDENDKLEDKPQKSFPGKFTALMYHRFITFSGKKDKGLIIIPCELIDRNGDKLKEIVLKYAKLWKLEEELSYYAKVVLERFMNPYVKHYLMSISLNSMSKYETRDLPSLLQFVKTKGKLPKRLVFSLAALMEFYKGKRGKEIIKLSDNADVLELYKTEWNKCDGTEAMIKNLVTTVLAYKKVWKMDLNEVKGLTDAVSHHLFNINKVGMSQALKEVL